MRIVLDTNVLVSALITPGRSAAKLLEEYILVEDEHGPLTLLLDERIVAEYREVLARRRFGFEPNLVDDLVAALEAVAIFVDAPALAATPTPDDDRPFLEVALAGDAAVIVTGNKKHFPETGRIEVLGPAELLSRLSDDESEPPA
ncbi:MAG: putative toxin-antitoxin system toxin component, PIN family [Deltaproteobacteria bacterium]|nr:putative toxin-antitoxin system toxin component, PIN family [Deltaproteobacteria bacterium]